jgi:hypothetical protein
MLRFSNYSGRNLPDPLLPLSVRSSPFSRSLARPNWGAIHQLLNIILKLGILALLPVSTLLYVVIVNNYS